MDFRLSPRYTVVKDAASPYHGCVQLGGKRVHGDYDLKGIVLPGQEQRILTLVTETLGQDARREPRFYAVQEFVNDAIGKPMVQHGAEDEYLDHSTDQDETIFVFFPEEREPKRLRGPAETRAWYEKELRGRFSTHTRCRSHGCSAARSTGHPRRDQQRCYIPARRRFRDQKTDEKTS